MLEIWWFSRVLGLDGLQIHDLSLAESSFGYLRQWWLPWRSKMLFVTGCSLLKKVISKVLRVVLRHVFRQFSLKIAHQVLKLLDFLNFSVVTDDCFYHFGQLEAKAIPNIGLESALSLEHTKLAKKFTQLKQGRFVENWLCKPNRGSLAFTSWYDRLGNKRQDIGDRILLSNLFSDELVVTLLIFFKLVSFEAWSLDIFGLFRCKRLNHSRGWKFWESSINYFLLSRLLLLSKISRLNTRTSLIVVEAALSWCTADLGDGGKRLWSLMSSLLARSQPLEQESHLGGVRFWLIPLR